MTSHKPIEDNKAPDVLAQDLVKPETAEVPTTTVYAYEVKLEQCAPGIRITVHSRNQDPDMAIKQAIDIYKQTKARLEAANEKVAPYELCFEIDFALDFPEPLLIMGQFLGSSGWLLTTMIH